MWNPFKKAKQSATNSAMKMAAAIAAKKIAKMSPEEQQKMMREAMNPKNKGKMLEVMEQMKASGQISDEQYRAAKQKLGL